MALSDNLFFEFGVKSFFSSSNVCSRGYVIILYASVSREVPLFYMQTGGASGIERSARIKRAINIIVLNYRRHVKYYSCISDGTNGLLVPSIGNLNILRSFDLILNHRFQL